MILTKVKYSKIIPVLFVLIAIPFLICSVNSNSIKLTNTTPLKELIGNMILVEDYEVGRKKSNFKIGQYEVTQELYEAVMGTNPSYYSNNPAEGENQARRPVEFVSWYDAINFCNKLTTLTLGAKECCYTITNIKFKIDDEEVAKEKFIKDDPTYVIFIESADVTINHNKKGFRLPTKDEWLFAAKGGLKSQNYIYAGSNNLDEIGWYISNSGKKTHEVGLLKPNELGIYDMTGNVNEFCEDLTFYTNTKNQTFPRRISCGGSALYNKDSSLLEHYDESLEKPGNGGQGFRLVCSEKNTFSKK
jgi:hypothetical protein